MIIAQTQAAPTSITGMDWAEFGLAGLVIGALFFVLVMLYRSHREERKEWRDEASQREERGTSAIDGLGDVVSELSNAIRELQWRNRE